MKFRALEDVWLAAIVVTSLALVLAFSAFAYNQSEVFSSINCRKISEGLDSCTFSCALSPKSPGQTGKFEVLHSIWTAIYVNETALPATLTVELPRRHYQYIGFLNIYDLEGRVGYGKPIPVMEC